LALNAVALASTVRLLVRWAYPTSPWRWWPAPGVVSPGSPEVALPLLLCGRFLLVNAEYLQINPLILWCEVWGLSLLARRLEVRGAAAVGLAGALKILPWLLIPWLAWRGRRRAAFLSAIFAAGWSVAPAAWFGWSRWIALVRDWPRAVAQGWGVNGPNQSAAAMLERFMSHGVRPWNAGAFSWEFVPASGSAWVTGGVALLALSAFVAAAMLWRRPLRLDSVAGLGEAGAVLGASVLFAPLAWVHYFVVLLVPATAVVAAHRRGLLPRGATVGTTILLAAGAVLVCATARLVVGARLAKIGLTMSDLTVAGLLICCASAWVAARSRA
jgi:hypothetical protein